MTVSMIDCKRATRDLGKHIHGRDTDSGRVLRPGRINVPLYLRTHHKHFSVKMCIVGRAPFEYVACLFEEDLQTVEVTNAVMLTAGAPFDAASEC
jgi:hypothetical protein